MRKRVCTQCGKNRQATSYRTERGRVCKFCQRQTRRASSRALRIEQTYDITSDEYDAILALQGGVCAACGEPRNYALHIDHDHAVERERGSRVSIRGLLCKRCNKLLRDCRDSVPLLRALIDYLLDPPARKVLDE